MFDRSLLQPARFEFTVVTDTHYMLDTAGQTVEFESRRKQTARTETALRQIQSLAPAFLLHLGDIAQEYPETARYDQAVTEARQQLDTWCPVRHHVVGNHDIGDKPDPTMPGLPVTEAALKTWENYFGPTWFSFDHQDVHFAAINSQILNTDLPQAQEQRQWLQRDLAAAKGKRIWLLLHLPLFLSCPDEPHLGHYDNVGQPDRDWLIDLVQQHQIQWIMSGHVHFPYYQRIGEARYLISQATSFTRPGFSHLFTSAPPNERGRDQAELLGFQHVRVMPDRFDVHLVRTSGQTQLPQPLEQGWQRVLTRLPAGLAAGRLGVSLNHPLASQTEIPMAWPSAIRQPVRNDLPLLALLELGAKQVRVPMTDCEDPLQQQRLRALRDEGVLVLATAIAQDPAVTPNRLAAARTHADQIELQLLEGVIDDHAQELLRACANSDIGPAMLSPITARQPVPGKQHPRTRHGYLPGELAGLNQQLARLQLCVGGVLCRLDPASAQAEVQTLRNQGDLPGIPRINLITELLPDSAGRPAAAAAALFAARQLDAGMLFVEPLIDMDRTMDALPGLLDTQCNPHPVFHALRLCNTLVGATDQHFQQATRQSLRHRLASEPVRIYRLEQALSRDCNARDLPALQTILDAGETLLMPQP